MTQLLSLRNSIPLRIEGNVPLEIDLNSNNNILIISKHQSYLTHGVHKFPAKFFPELPRFLINKYSNRGDIVLDPMCGSGTALLEAILQNRHAIGVDIDPIAKLVSKVKTTPIIYGKLLDGTNLFLQNCITNSLKSDGMPQIPDFNYRDKWFKPFVLKELGIIKEAILKIKKSQYFSQYSEKQIQDLIDFLLVIFSSIIRDVSNADPHCTRTVIRKNLIKKIEHGETIRKFFVNLNKQIVGMKDFSLIYNKLYYKIVDIKKDSDARNIKLKENSTDLAVTSPPYANAVDYPRTHQLELYWLGLVNGDPLANLKRNYIGTETIYKNEYQECPKSEYLKLNYLISSVYQKDPRRAYILFKFFKDMEKNLEEIHRVLKVNSRYCVVIGNNTVRDIYVKSHEIITEMAISDKIGFELETYFHSGLINHFIKIPRKERMPGEWILVLRKTK